jgi:hypothetical protein
MIIGITGNAMEFKLRSKFDQIFKQALVKATVSTAAWLTTGGTDSGVMKLAGEAMKNASTPVLGICSWGVIKGRTKLIAPKSLDIAARIKNQILAKNHRQHRPLPMHATHSPGRTAAGLQTPYKPLSMLGGNTNSAAATSGADKSDAFDKPMEYVGTANWVIEQYAAHKHMGWADPETPPTDLGDRTTFVAIEGGNKLTDLRYCACLVTPAPSSNRPNQAAIRMMARDGHPDIALFDDAFGTGKMGRGTLGRWGPNQAIGEPWTTYI